MLADLDYDPSKAPTELVEAKLEAEVGAPDWLTRADGTPAKSGRDVLSAVARHAGASVRAVLEDRSKLAIRDEAAYWIARQTDLPVSQITTVLGNIASAAVIQGAMRHAGRLNIPAPRAEFGA